MERSQLRSTKRLVQALLLLLCVILLMGAGDPDARFEKLGHKMMCACGCGQILLECNHVGCTYSDTMRGKLTTAIARGDNDDLVLQGFVQEYGTTVLAAPSTTGFNRVAWVMPYLALVLGIGLVGWVVHTWNKRPPSPPPPGSGPRIPASELDQFRQQARKETEL
jgi:cytochrome c-type biogenesis protein CcmH/NrfF